MAKKMLITGASSGIGKSIAEKFENSEYEIITVARTGDMTENGDLMDEEFRQYLINKYVPHIFVNNAGAFMSDITSTMTLNVVAAMHLFEGFYQKMMRGHIINMNSFGSKLAGYPDMGRERANYYASKKSFLEFVRMHARNKERPVHICSIIPSVVRSGMNDMDDVYKNIPEDYDKVTYNSTFPIPPEYIADVVEWVIAQPPYVDVEEICLTMHNKITSFNPYASQPAGLKTAGYKTTRK